MRVNQKKWNTEYKRKYQMRKCTESKHEVLIKQRQKNAAYKRQYRARINNVNEFWWDVLHALGKEALQPLTFMWNRKCSHCLSMLLTGELAEFCCNRGKR
ncbi:32071_t:CDS:1, partial [Racocetra persica]